MHGELFAQIGINRKKKNPDPRVGNLLGIHAQMGNIVVVVVRVHHGRNFRNSLPLAVWKRRTMMKEGRLLISFPTILMHMR
jgi:hypothetical protein